jgi:hypothetical protein
MGDSCFLPSLADVVDLGEAASGATSGAEAGAGETYFRTMSEADLNTLKTTGAVPSTGETFISESAQESARYDGATVQFSVQAGTKDALTSIGVRDTSALASGAYPDMPIVSGGWAETNAFFKGEGDLINIGLGRGSALDLFNQAIQNWTVIGSR